MAGVLVEASLEAGYGDEVAYVADLSGLNDFDRQLRHSAVGIARACMQETGIFDPTLDLCIAYATGIVTRAQAQYITTLDGKKSEIGAAIVEALSRNYCAPEVNWCAQAIGRLGMINYDIINSDGLALTTDLRSTCPKYPGGLRIDTGEVSEYLRDGPPVGEKAALYRMQATHLAYKWDLEWVQSGEWQVPRADGPSSVGCRVLHGEVILLG